MTALSGAAATTGADTLRDTGIGAIGRVPWGTHLCQFYDSPQDLVDILVPYFATGLAAGELCMWVTSEPLETSAARAALAAQVPDLDRYEHDGAIRILSYRDWYLRDGHFDGDRILDVWVATVTYALAHGFAGLRLSGNTFWLERRDWYDFTQYEEMVDDVVADHPMIALCTYSLNRCTASDVLDVLRNHQYALAKRGASWMVVVPSPGRHRNASTGEPTSPAP